MKFNMFMKRFVPAAMAMFAFFCSGFVSESYLNRAIAETSKAETTTAAENKVKSMYPEFMELVKNGVNEAELTKFAKKNFDTEAISKRFCGEKNDKLIKTIIKFLIWRLKTEALQSVKGYILEDEIQSIDKGKSVCAKCKLKGKTDTINMNVIFSKFGKTIGNITELVILEIPLIEGAKVPMKKYFEENGIKINKLKPAERAEKSCFALEEFIQENSKK